MDILYEVKEQSKGVFWLIDNKIYAFPFYDSDVYYSGIAKSGDTYNHKKLWNDIKPKGCNKSYNYYPRGRVDIDNKGRAIIYMNPNISEEDYLDDIKIEFGLRSTPIIHYDYSDHYKCYLDSGWKKD